MSTLRVIVGADVATTFAAATTACAKSVAMCQDTATSFATCAPTSGWIAGWTSTTTDQLRQKVANSPRRYERLGPVF